VKSKGKDILHRGTEPQRREKAVESTPGKQVSRLGYYV
jgi:hypothetical protein